MPAVTDPSGLRQTQAEAPSRLSLFLTGLILMASGWSVLWTISTRWNPLAFTSLWTGAAVVLWAASKSGYPGIRRHLGLAAVSIPVWWWFELINTQVRNWEYVGRVAYGPAEYAFLSSLAFSTVVPVLMAASALLSRVLPSKEHHPMTPGGVWTAGLIGIAVTAQVAVFLFPKLLFPLVWVAPFLFADGLVSWAGGRSFVKEIFRGRWREPVMVGLAGLLCGFLWEFWNYWSAPKWIYEVPLAGFGRVFEMPILGYGGYVPFAWFVIQLVQWLDIVREKQRAVAAARRRSE